MLLLLIGTLLIIAWRRNINRCSAEQEAVYDYVTQNASSLNEGSGNTELSQNVAYGMCQRGQP